MIAQERLQLLADSAPEDADEDTVNGGGEGEVLRQIQAILYSTEDGFEVPEGNEVSSSSSFFLLSFPFRSKAECLIADGFIFDSATLLFVFTASTRRRRNFLKDEQICNQDLGIEEESNQILKEPKENQSNSMTEEMITIANGI